MKQPLLAPTALLAALPVALLVGTACTKPEAPATAAEAHARVTKELASITSYRAKVTSEIHADAMLSRMRPDAGPVDVEPMRGTLELEVALPDKMRMSATTQLPNASMSIESVFDGATAWSALTLGEQTQQVVLDQKKLALPGKPFDVGYNARGFGLMEGEDLVGTVATLLRNWRFTELAPMTFEGKQALALKGAIDLDAAIDDLLGKNGERGGQLLVKGGDTERRMLVQAFSGAIGSMKACELFVTPQGAVLGWTLGGDAGLMQRAVVTSFEKNVPVTIALDPAKRAAGNDLTAQVLQSRDVAPVDAQKLAALREELKASVR